MNALLFPGQGSQAVGMALEFYKEFKIVKEIFDQADNKLNFKISKMILEGPENQLQLTQNAQPAILTVSYSIFTVLKNEFGFKSEQFEFYAGHSLGEYSALVCSQSLNFQDALFLLFERGKSMQSAVPVGKGSMIAVLGLSIDEIDDFLKKNNTHGGTCEIANDNASGQVILSGEKNVVFSIKDKLKESKIKCIPLKVSAPFHCALMKPAAEIMREKINSTNFKKPQNKIISNVTAKTEEDPNIIKELLVKQIFSTVKWRESLINMSNMGVKKYVEIGPGKTLTGMVKRTLKDINTFSINTITDMKNLSNEFKK